jgi:hypothetical protein
MRRVHLHHMPHDKPVEQHPQRRQVLLHRWLGMGALQVLDKGCDVNRPYRRQVEQAARFAPVRESARPLIIGPPRVSVTDVRREEFVKIRVSVSEKMLLVVLSSLRVGSRRSNLWNGLPRLFSELGPQQLRKRASRSRRRDRNRARPL